jgi:hypothetical protein
MLNPSTADEVENDPTVERCQRRAIQMGYNCLVVTNIFAFRSTDPKGLLEIADPVGPKNDYYLKYAANNADLIVCAWGTNGNLYGRGEEVARNILNGHKLTALKLSKDGIPCHPLYLPYSLLPEKYEPLYS